MDDKSKSDRIEAFAMTQRTVDHAEITEAVKYLGWLPAPGIANDPLHNPKLERLFRSIKDPSKGRLSPRLVAAIHQILLCRKINFAASACAFA